MSLTFFCLSPPFFHYSKGGCDLRYVLATRRFALLVKICSEKGRSSVEILVGERSLYSNYSVQSSFLFEMTFSMTSNVSIPLNKRDFYDIRLPTRWL